MYNFFVEKEQRQGEYYLVTGSDFNHIKNVLRMKIGDRLLISDCGVSSLCELDGFDNNCVRVKIIEENYNDTSLPIEIYLFQGLPKGDKMELIIQKAVELGACGIIPTVMNRCVVKLDDKKKKSKQERWQAVAESAAKQSKRNIIPEVFLPLTYKEALQKAGEMDLFLVPFESKNGMSDTKNAFEQIKKGMKIGILIGSEGGFEDREIEEAVKMGGKVISLGKRILRAETAAITSVAMCMLYAECELNGDEK